MTKLIIANWKSHKTVAQAQQWIVEYLDQAVSKPQVQVVVAPAFPLVPVVNQAIRNRSASSAVALAVQDISSFPAGAYTGAVSVENLQDLGVTYAVVGHSERRRYFHETHSEVANKVRLAIEAGITPIVCVDQDYLLLQASAIPEELYSKCVIAYEPLEAIGSGQSQPVSEVLPVVSQIKSLFGQVPVIYGGSVSSQSVSEYVAICDGVLVGTHSLAVADFGALVRAV